MIVKEWRWLRMPKRGSGRGWRDARIHGWRGSIESRQDLREHVVRAGGECRFSWGSREGQERGEGGGGGERREERGETAGKKNAEWDELHITQNNPNPSTVARAASRY